MIDTHLFFSFILLHSILCQLQLNLYYTDLLNQNTDIFEHDCLRLFLINGYNVDAQMMSFCLSENASVFDIKDDEKMSKYSFARLFKNNITAEQLYYWSAPIDTVEKYQDYLNTKNSSLEKEIFYNCTLGRFGHRCQYEISIYISQKFSLSENICKFFDTYYYAPMTMTCYEHLKCIRSSSSACLDWTEICNGQIDCLNDGIDEKDCWQLEIKQCKENEYLSPNGQCLSKSLSMIKVFKRFLFERLNVDAYPGHPMFNCRYHYNLFEGCDDMACYPNFVTSSCVVNRQDLLLTAMYSNEDTSLSKNCSLALACLLNSITCRKFCEKNQCVQIVQDSCPETMFYPNVSILFGNIYFGYMKKDLVYSTIVRYICYNTTDYDDFFLHTEKFLFDNIRCIDTEEFYLRINQSYLSRTDLNIIDILHTTLKRYHLSMKYTPEICNRSNMYQCINSPKCVHISRVLDRIHDCPQMDDENLSLIRQTMIMKMIEKTHFKCQFSNKYVRQQFVADRFCDCQSNETDYCEDEHLDIAYIKTNIIFQHTCDRFDELLPILIEGHNHTDETECQQWECDNIYTHCDNRWNCPYTEDEMNCSSKISFNCSSNFRRCVSLQTNQLICLTIEKVNDGFIDCFSATDEESIYKTRITTDHIDEFKNFYCINQNSYSFISRYSLCDGEKDCEHGDDERFCTTNRTDLEVGICFSTDYEYISDEEKFFCNYMMHGIDWSIKPFKFPSIVNDTKEIKHRLELSSSFNQLSSESQHQCHIGLPIRVWLNQKNKLSISACFCPPNYYGSQCQYQNQRISLILAFQTLSESSRTLFIIIVSLIDDSHEKVIHSYESFTYLSVRDCRKEFFFNLHYSTRPKNARKQYFIRVTVYEQLTLYHRGSLLFPIEFSFLPVHRLGFFIDIPSNNTQAISCKNSQCQHGLCMKYWNHPENSTYCHCDKEWRGKYCHIPYRCECSSDAICFDILSNNRSICLCPKNRFGTRCLISSTICSKNNNSACLNGGECIVTQDYVQSNRKFACLCRQGYSGDRCEIVHNKLILSFDEQILLSQSIFIHFISMQGGKLARSTTFETISLRHDSLTIYWSQLYHMAFVELLNGDYYLGVVLEEACYPGSIENRTITSSDRCPNITELFNQTFLQWHLIRRIKYYHLPCQNQSLNISCFHDEVHFCLCYDFYGKRLTNCFRFDHDQTYDCSGRSECEHNSRCLQDNDICPMQSMCLCENCFYGRKCQLRTDQFGLSLDAILGYHIKSISNISLQPLIIKISLALTILFMSIGLINGILSLITFANKTVLEFGCGLYLLGISITTIIIIIMFSFKFLILLLTHMSIITDELFLRVQCYSVDFFIRVCLCLEQWLTACVACERAVTVIQGVRFVKQKSKEVAKKVITILIIVIVLTFLHDPLSRDLSYEYDDEYNYEIKRTWCIVRYQRGVDIYNYIIQTFHFIGPFLTNLITSIILIVKRSRQNITLFNDRSFKVILREQLKEHKNLLIAPIVLVTLGIPRLILIYTSKCMQSANDAVWFYLFGYFISFIPSMLTFLIFVLPSKFYKKEFHEAVVHYRKIIRRKLRLTS